MGESAWALRTALPRHGINVFFVREDGGVALFDAGSRETAGELRRLGDELGGIRRIVLSHGHPDHRGTAKSIGVPVHCHAGDIPDVEGDGGRGYGVNSGQGPLLLRMKSRVTLRLRDSGPLEVAGTVAEGDRVGAYEVLELPGHSPGQIGLWSPEERILFASDCFYTHGNGTAGLPLPVFNYDDEQAIASIRRIIDLSPRVAWPGHGGPLTGDVSGALEAALRG